MNSCANHFARAGAERLPRGRPRADIGRSRGDLGQISASLDEHVVEKALARQLH
eukprot:CAMPEP_0185503620 /NCGR_PEP_ID=MMETSP1366-20130426/32385_1 /TAXON_ID=38817 /ORGANISM="Gephyrocapsa oceanica, Strain RCC1303" /LENGTH=53 /DNA_ID=CAMNT_0028113479 /DNA_START=69 /DNA_END=227 /DNA_ORIENTATION=-